MIMQLSDAAKLSCKVIPRYNHIYVHFVLVIPRYKVIHRYNKDEMHVYEVIPRYNHLVMNVHPIPRYNPLYPGIGKTMNDLHIYCYT